MKTVSFTEYLKVNFVQYKVETVSLYIGQLSNTFFKKALKPPTFQAFISIFGRISLNSVLLLLLVNFLSRSRLELMQISLIANISLSLTHLLGLQLLGLPHKLTEMTFFICTNKINLLNLK